MFRNADSRQLQYNQPAKDNTHLRVITVPPHTDMIMIWLLNALNIHLNIQLIFNLPIY
jgi:hypothetical protein